MPARESRDIGNWMKGIKMITFICLWWIGFKLTAPDWYYVISVIGLAVRLFNSIRDAKRNRKIKERFN